MGWFDFLKSKPAADSVAGIVAETGNIVAQVESLQTRAVALMTDFSSKASDLSTKHATKLKGFKDNYNRMVESENAKYAEKSAELNTELSDLTSALAVIDTVKDALSA